MTDVKELIPEFFYLPDFLVNREGILRGYQKYTSKTAVQLSLWVETENIYIP